MSQQTFTSIDVSKDAAAICKFIKEIEQQDSGRGNGYRGKRYDKSKKQFTINHFVDVLMGKCCVLLWYFMFFVFCVMLFFVLCWGCVNVPKF